MAESSSGSSWWLIIILFIVVFIGIYVLSKYLNRAANRGIDTIENKLHEKKNRENGPIVESLASIYGSSNSEPINMSIHSNDENMDKESLSIDKNDEENMIVCPDCGNIQDEKYEFCSQCGTNLKNMF